MGLAYEENIVRKIGFIIINVFYAITAFAALLSEKCGCACSCR